MRRVLWSILIAVGLLAIPVIYIEALPSVRLCPEGWSCGPTSVEGGAGWVFLPGILLALPFLFFRINDSVWVLIVITANIAIYASLVWFLLKRRARRFEEPRKTTLPI
jgi:hypothetical protein